MKVLVLGAGASKAAGYPLAAEVIPAIERDVRASRNLQLEAAWKQWEESRDAATGPLRLLLNDPDPEVALSVLDLCTIADSAQLSRAVVPGRIEEVLGQSHSDSEIRVDSFQSADHAWLFNARTALRRLIDCLAEYLRWKSHDDSANPGRRDYLRELLKPLEAGDAIITLNWDTTVERTLAESVAGALVMAMASSRSYNQATSPAQSMIVRQTRASRRK